MSRRIADLLIKIGADSYEFQQKAQQVEKRLGSLEKKLTSVGKSLSLKLSALLAALGGVSLHLADVQAKAEAKVQQALKVTNRAVGYNFRQLADYASELQGKTIFGDETILDKSTARLLAFTNITGKNFKRTQALALGLATALEMDLGSASLQLGKALSDPATKLSSLSRAGITFSKEQTEVIKKLAETGDIAKAQAMILDELERKFGGQAEAAARTGLGAVQQLKNAWGDFLERIGAAIMPFATKIAGALSTVVQMLQSMSPAMMQTIVVVAGLVAAIGPLSLGIGAVIKVLPMLAAGFTALLSPVGLIMAAVLALGAAFAYARIQKQKMIDEMAETESLNELERKLQENIAEQKEIIVTTTKTRMVPNFGGLVAGFTLQKVPDESKLAPPAQRVRPADGCYREETRNGEEGGRGAGRTGQGNGRSSQADRRADEVHRRNQRADGAEHGHHRQIAGADRGPRKEETAARIDRRRYRCGERRDREAAKRAGAHQEYQARRSETSRQDGRHSARGLRVGTAGAETQNGRSETRNIAIRAADAGDIRRGTRRALRLGGRQQRILAGARRRYGFDGRELHDGTDGEGLVVLGGIGACPRHDCGGDDALRPAGVEVYGRQHRRSGGGYRADHCRRFGIRRADESDPDAVRQFSEEYRLAAHRVRRDGHRLQVGAEIRPPNPWAAIAIGAAMVAAAAVMTALINKNAEKSVPALANGGLAYGPTYAMVGDNPNAGTDPEVIAPLSKLQAMLPTGSSAQTLRITLGGQLTAKGRDLVYVLGKENFKSEVLGG